MTMYAEVNDGEFNGFTHKRPLGHVEYIEMTDEEHAELYSRYCETEKASFAINDGKVIIEQNGDITSNEDRRDGLISEADGVIRPLADERDAEVISDSDLKRWKAWVKYRKALRELDVESVPDVKWPTKPQ